MVDREANLSKILAEINGAYSDLGKNEASRDLDEYIDNLLIDIDNNEIKAPELYKLIRMSIKALLDNVQYGIEYYEPLLDRCIGLLHKVYLLDEGYRRKITRLLLAMHPIYNHYTNEYYRVLKLFLDEETARDAIEIAKKVKFGPDINLLLVAYDVLNVPLENRISKLEKYIGRYGVTEYLLWLYYECSMPNRLKEFIDNYSSNRSFNKQCDIAYYYYYLLNDDKENALLHIRYASLYDEDLKLYFDYVNDVSDNETEIKWYYDNKKYEFLLKILNKLKLYDRLMEVIREANKYSFYKAYSKVLLPKYNKEYREFLISYVERKLNRTDVKPNYERLTEVVRLVTELDPSASERLKLLNQIHRDDNLVEALKDEIEELK